MDNNMFMPLRQQLLAAHQEIRECNAYSSKFGLVLSETEITDLVTGRAEALRASGRIEFGGGILPKLIEAFCDSPYIEQENSRFASVWIDKKKRIIFSADDNKITVIQCGGHYDDK